MAIALYLLGLVSMYAAMFEEDLPFALRVAMIALWPVTVLYWLFLVIAFVVAAHLDDLA